MEGCFDACAALSHVLCTLIAKHHYTQGNWTRKGCKDEQGERVQAVEQRLLTCFCRIWASSAWAACGMVATCRAHVT